MLYEVITDIKFFITSQNVSNAINIIEDDIFVSEPILFDFEINPIIIANVKIEKGYYYYYEWSVVV